MNTITITNTIHSAHANSAWKAPARHIEVEPWIFAGLVVAVVLAIGSWQPQPKAAPDSPSDQTTLASAPARS